MPVGKEKTRILVVEDQEGPRDLVRQLLEAEGYEVRCARDGQEGLKTFFSWRPNLAVLDVIMPGMDGWTLLQRIQEVSEVPVILLTSLEEDHHKTRGFRSGAEDYLVKPFSHAEFLARVEARLRKNAGATAGRDSYEDPQIHIDFSRHEVYVRGCAIGLSPQEFRLLAVLVKHAGTVLSIDDLLNQCWEEGVGAPENVRVYIGYLRSKIEENASRPEIIETVRGFGYRYRPATR